MQTEFSKLDSSLEAYFEWFLKAMDESYSQSYRTSIASIPFGSDDWKQFMASLNVPSMVPTSPIPSPDKFYRNNPLIFAFSSLVELLIYQLFPATELQKDHDKLIQVIQIWVLRYWLEQFATQKYSFDFQMILEFLARVLKPFDAHSGRNFNEVLVEFKKIFSESLSENASADNLFGLQKKLTQTLQDFQQKNRVFEQKVIFFEKQQMNNFFAKQKAEKIIESILSNHELPRWACKFILEHWRRALHLLILKNTECSPEVDTAEQLLKDLVDSLLVKESSQMMTMLSTVISPVRSKTRELFEKVVIEESILDEFLFQLEKHHMAVIEGNLYTPSEDKFELCSKPEVMEEPDPKVVSLCKVGTWLHYITEQSAYNCRIIERDMKYKKIILVNYSGARVCSLAFHEVEYALQQNRLAPLSLECMLESVMEYLKAYLLSQIESIKGQIQEKINEEIKTTVLQRLEQSRLDRLNVEAARMEALLRKEQAQQDAIRMEKITEMKMYLDSISSGTRFIDHTQSDLIIEFVVRLSKNGHLIFVDHRGVKVAEHDTQWIAERLVDNQWELLSQAPEIENTLEGLVAHQRESYIKLKAKRT